MSAKGPKAGITGNNSASKKSNKQGTREGAQKNRKRPEKGLGKTLSNSKIKGKGNTN